MIKTVPAKMEVVPCAGEFYVRVTMSDGFVTSFCDAKTERGAKRMLTINAKRFGLTIVDGIARQEVETTQCSETTEPTECTVIEEAPEKTPRTRSHPAHCYHAAALGTGAPICKATGKCVAVAPAVWHGIPVENRCRRCTALITGTMNALKGGGSK